MSFDSFWDCGCGDGDKRFASRGAASFSGSVGLMMVVSTGASIGSSLILIISVFLVFVDRFGPSSLLALSLIGLIGFPSGAAPFFPVAFFGEAISSLVLLAARGLLVGARTGVVDVSRDSRLIAASSLSVLPPVLSLDKVDFLLPVVTGGTCALVVLVFSGSSRAPNFLFDPALTGAGAAAGAGGLWADSSGVGNVGTVVVVEDSSADSLFSTVSVLGTGSFGSLCSGSAIFLVVGGFDGDSGMLE